MEKDGKVHLGSTTCDYCHRPATITRGRLVLCADHARIHDREKSASAQTVPLKAAPIEFSDKHE